MSKKNINLSTKLTKKFVSNFLFVSDEVFRDRVESVWGDRKKLTLEEFICDLEFPFWSVYGLVHALAFNGMLSKHNPEWNLMHNSKYWKSSRDGMTQMRFQLLMILAYGEIVGDPIGEECDERTR